MVFFWFLVFSVPTGMLMNKIGRKKTVLLSMVITFIGLLIPIFVYNDVAMFLSSRVWESEIHLCRFL